VVDDHVLKFARCPVDNDCWWESRAKQVNGVADLAEEPRERTGLRSLVFVVSWDPLSISLAIDRAICHGAARVEI